MKFDDNDRRILNGLVYDPNVRPGYEVIRGCLVWEDERTLGISNEGYELLSDLWGCRGFMHRGLQPPDRLRMVWKIGLRDVPGWPGFRRMELTEEDHAFLNSSIVEFENAGDY